MLLIPQQALSTGTAFPPGRLTWIRQLNINRSTYSDKTNTEQDLRRILSMYCNGGTLVIVQLA